MLIRKMVMFFFIMLLVAGSGTAVSAAEQNDETGILEAAGIIDTTEEQQAGVTRRQICVIALRMLGYDPESLPAEELPFSDVDETDEARAAIAAAYKIGLISGYDNGKFLPDDTINYEQLTKILIRVLGYENQAATAGGYPTGYMSVAQRLGLTKGISFDATKPVIWEHMYQILLKTINTDLCELVSLKTANGEITEKYVIGSDKTILSQYLHFESGEGIVTANYATALDSPESGLRRNELRIGKTVFQTAGTGYDDYLGYRVKYFYQPADDKNDMPVLRYMSISERKNDITVYDTDSIESYDASTNTYTIYEKSRLIKRKIDGNADVIYNGVACSDYTEAEMNISGGSITLIDNDLDGVEDVVLVTNLKTYVVDGVNRESGDVYFKNTAELLRLDTTDKEIVIRTVGDSRPFDIASLHEWDVLSIAKSKNTEGKVCFLIYRGSGSAFGEITQIDSDYENLVCCGETYRIAKDFAEYMVKNPAEIILKAGVSATFYLNHLGEVAYADVNGSAAKNYAVLLNIGMENGVSAAVKLRLLLSNGEEKVLTCAKNVYLNEQKMPAEQFYKDADNLLSYDFHGTSEKTIRQLVDYTLSATGELFTLHTYSGFSTQIQSLYKRSDIFGYANRVKTTTPIFVIPNDENINTNEIDDYFAVKKISDYVSDHQYHMEFYEMDSVLRADVAVEYVNLPEETESVSEASLMVITKVADTLNAEGELVKKVTGLINNKGNSLFIEESVDIEDYNRKELIEYSIRPGDIIAYGQNSKGYIKSIRVLATLPFYQAGNEFYSFGSSGRFDGLFVTCAGRIDEYKNNSDIVISTNGIKIAAGIANAVVTVYDAKRSRASAGDSADIAKGDYVVCRFRYGTMRDIMVIRNAWQ